MTVLDGIVIAIFDVAGVVGLVTDQMLPEPALPDAAFVPRRTDNAQPLIRWECLANRVLISLQRTEKLASSGGSFQIAWR